MCSDFNIEWKKTNGQNRMNMGCCCVNLTNYTHTNRRWLNQSIFLRCIFWCVHTNCTRLPRNVMRIICLLLRCFLKADNRIINGCVIIGSSKLFIFVSVFHNCQRVIFSYKLKRNSRWTWIWLSISLSFFLTTIHMQKQKSDSHLEPLSSISSSFQLFSHSLVVRCDSIFHNDTNYFAFFLFVGWLFFFLSLSLAVLCALLFFLLYR